MRKTSLLAALWMASILSLTLAAPSSADPGATLSQWAHADFEQGASFGSIAGWLNTGLDSSGTAYKPEVCVWLTTEDGDEHGCGLATVVIDPVSLSGARVLGTFESDWYEGETISFEATWLGGPNFTVSPIIQPGDVAMTWDRDASALITIQSSKVGSVTAVQGTAGQTWLWQRVAGASS